MFFRFDHLVHVVEEPLEAGKDFEEALGWNATPGGKHIHWGTYNALSYFGLSYIEWVGVFDDALARTTEFGKWVARDAERGEGVKQFVLRTRHMDDIVTRWTNAGVHFVGPIPGERKKDDGSVLRWRLLFPERTDAELFPLPFIIEWEQTDAEREQALVSGGLLAGNDADRNRLLEVDCVVRDAGRLAERWNTWYGSLGLTAELSPDGTSVNVSGTGSEIKFRAAQTPEEQQWLERHGERPYGVCIGASTVAARNIKEAQTVDRLLHGLHVVTKRVY